MGHPAGDQSFILLMRSATPASKDGSPGTPIAAHEWGTEMLLLVG